MKIRLGGQEINPTLTNKLLSKSENLIILTIVTIIILPVLFFITSPYLTTYIAHQTSITVVINSTTATTSISKTRMMPIKSLTYIKRGGVKGIYNILEISKPNEAIYRCIFSPRFGNRSFPLSTNESEIESLFEKIIKEYRILDYNGKMYSARQIYDYFTYEIFLELEDGENIKVKWVDEWASEEPIPENLTRIKEILEDFIRQKLDHAINVHIIEPLIFRWM